MIDWKKLAVEIIGTIIGTLIMAFAISLFLLPNELSTGGFSGIATGLNHIFNFPVGVTILCLNIPLFLIARSKLGREFFFKSMIGTVSLSGFIEIFDKYTAVTQDKMLASIYGRNFSRNWDSHYSKV